MQLVGFFSNGCNHALPKYWIAQGQRQPACVQHDMQLLGSGSWQPVSQSVSWCGRKPATVVAASDTAVWDAAMSVCRGSW